jgi:hypothetical protein
MDKFFEKWAPRVFEWGSGVGGLTLLTLGTMDIQHGHVDQGGPLITLAATLLGYVIGKKKPKKGGGETNGD